MHCNIYHHIFHVLEIISPNLRSFSISLLFKKASSERARSTPAAARKRPSTASKPNRPPRSPRCIIHPEPLGSLRDASCRIFFMVTIWDVNPHRFGYGARLTMVTIYIYILIVFIASTAPASALVQRALCPINPQCHNLRWSWDKFWDHMMIHSKSPNGWYDWGWFIISLGLPHYFQRLDLDLKERKGTVMKPVILPEADQWFQHFVTKLKPPPRHTSMWKCRIHSDTTFKCPYM